MEIITKIIVLIGFAFIVAIILAFPVMWLWNWLMPTIFGLMEIGVNQALGLLLLSGFLFRSSSSS